MFYILKHNSNGEKQIHSFNESKRKRMELSCIKKLSVLLRKITSKHNAGFYCLNCLQNKKKKKLESRVYVIM